MARFWIALLAGGWFVSGSTATASDDATEYVNVSWTLTHTGQDRPYCEGTASVRKGAAPTSFWVWNQDGMGNYNYKSTLQAKGRRVRLEVDRLHPDPSNHRQFTYTTKLVQGRDLRHNFQPEAVNAYRLDVEITSISNTKGDSSHTCR